MGQYSLDGRATRGGLFKNTKGAGVDSRALKCELEQANRDLGRFGMHYKKGANATDHPAKLTRVDGLLVWSEEAQVVLNQ